MNHQRLHRHNFPHRNVPHGFSQTTRSLDARTIDFLANVQRSHLTSNSIVGVNWQKDLGLSSKLNIPHTHQTCNDTPSHRALLDTSLLTILKSKELFSLDRQIMHALQPMGSIATKDAWNQKSEQNIFGRFETSAIQRNPFETCAVEAKSMTVKDPTYLDTGYEMSTLQGIQSITSDLDSIFNQIYPGISKCEYSLQYLTAPASSYGQTMHWQCAGSDRDDILDSLTRNKEINFRDSDSFPIKLHRLLIDLTNVYGGTDIACFLPNGKAFLIQDPYRFEHQVMKSYFPRMNSLASFQRQLNIYEFHRINHGPFRGAYYHSKFLRDVPSLSINMKPMKGQRKPCSGSI
jgi:hypothetical protein